MRSLLLTLALSSIALAAPDADTVVAITGARVETITGGAIEPGVVVVRGGKIEAVGKVGDVEVPGDAEVLDAAGHVLLPSFVHPASRLGMTGNGGGNGNSVSPDRNAKDDLNPWRPELPWIAANGFATLGSMPGRGIVGGRGVAAQPVGDSVEAVLRREDAFLRVDVSSGSRFTSTLAKVFATARKELGLIAAHERAKAKWEKDKAQAAKDKKPAPKEPGKPKVSASNEPYRKVLTGDTALLAICGGNADASVLAEALSDEVVRGEELRLYVIISGDFHRAPEVLLELGATCVVRGGVASVTGLKDRYCPARFLHELGVPIVLFPGTETRDGLRDYPRLLARTVRAGLPRDVAYRAATLGAAELLGLGKETGAIEKGRRADLQLFSGDPLLSTTRRVHVWIDGKLVEETP